MRLRLALARMISGDRWSSSDATYLKFLDPSFAEMIDVLLVVEGVRLPAHSAILAANSKSFAEAFAKQAPAASTADIPDLPLPGDSLADTTKALTYLYRHCVFSNEAETIKSPEAARPIIKFSHKYGMQGMLDACETYFMSKVLKIPATDRYEGGVQAVVAWIALAEEFGLSNLLAQCELFLIQDQDVFLWSDKALLSDSLSRASLLRMLRGLQSSRGRLHAHSSITGPSRAYDPKLSELLEWQKES